MYPDRFGQSLFMESKLSDNKRDKLKDSEFGIPDKRAYPLNDKSHVDAAVRMFPHADDSDKKELAKRIISKAKEFNMDTSGWDSLNEYIQESVERINDKGESIPETCNKCGSKVGLYLKGEPVWLCSNKDCNKYYGTPPCHVQESMLQDIKNGVNPNSKKLFFHISLDKDLNGKTFKPRIPSYLTKKSNNDSNGYKEDKTTPRVCFSPSIEGCLRAILSAEKNLDIVGERIYVYIPDKPISEYKVKTNKEIIKEKLVFDAKMTKEMWILEPVKLKLYGVIYVDQVKNIRQSETLEGDPIGKVDYKWHWAVSPKYVDGVIDWISSSNKDKPVQESDIHTLNDIKLYHLEPEMEFCIFDKSIKDMITDEHRKEYRYYRLETHYDMSPEVVEDWLLKHIPNEVQINYDYELPDFDRGLIDGLWVHYISDKLYNEIKQYVSDIKFKPITLVSSESNKKCQYYIFIIPYRDVIDWEKTSYVKDTRSNEYVKKAVYDKLKLQNHNIFYISWNNKNMFGTEDDNRLQSLLEGITISEELNNIMTSSKFKGIHTRRMDGIDGWELSNEIYDYTADDDYTFIEPNETIQEAMVDVAFNNLRCKIADALGDKYKVSNIIHNSLNTAKDKFTVALSSNTSKFVNVVNDTSGVSVLGYLRNISMSHAFDRLMEFFTSPEFVNESATIKIKEEYHMSDFVRDPSILRLFQEAKDSDENEKEEEIDEDLDESSEDIVDDDSEESTTFGSDTSDVQNEYNPKDVETLNNLIAAENDAMNDYFEAGKNTNDDVLSRLYADIGAEERFHAEQLLYAKSVVTGEKYEPRDPDVKKEYEELLEMGMDEETAMTTAVDKLNITSGSSEDIDTEELEEALSITESMLCMTADQLEMMLMICESDKYDINEFCDDVETFVESYYFEGAVNLTDNKQVKEFKAKQDPLFFILRAFKNLFKSAIKIVKISKQSVRVLTVKRRNIADFIQKNGIKGLFAKGVSLYFYDIKNPEGVDLAPIQYCDLLYRITGTISKEVGYNLEPMPFNVVADSVQRIQFKDVNHGINIIKGITLTKTKIIVNDQNEDQIAKIFFGYTKDKVMVNKAIKGDKGGEKVEISLKSNNIYAHYENITNVLEYYAKNCEKFLDYLEKMDNDINSIKYKDKNKYNKFIDYMKIINKGFNIFLKALAHDMKTVTNMFNQMANETQAKDREDNEPVEATV